MNVWLLLILSLIGISSIPCFSQKHAILKGRINPPASLLVEWHRDPLARGTHGKVEIKPDIKSGLFQTRIPIDKPTFIYIQDIKTLLVPGDTALVEIKNNNGLLTITFTGKDSARFNFSRRLMNRIERQYAVTQSSLSIIQKEQTENLASYNQFAEGNNHHLRFKQIANVLISSTYYHKLLLHYVNDSSKQGIPTNRFEQMSSSVLNESDMLVFERYLDFLYDFNRYSYARGDDTIVARALIESAEQNFTGDVRDALLFHIFRKVTIDCDLRNKKEVTSLKNALMKIYVHDPEKLTVINTHYKHYQSVQQRLPPEIYKAKLLTENKQQISIEDLIKIHKKPLYLDFWASWCGPCIEEMKASKKIYPEMNDKISFVYIADNSDDSVWKKGIDKTKVMGTHVRLTTYDQCRLFEKYFGIEGIPHYAIIDKHGRLIHFNAPRPSEFESLKKIIEPLLILQPPSVTK